MNDLAKAIREAEIDMRVAAIFDEDFVDKFNEAAREYSKDRAWCEARGINPESDNAYHFVRLHLIQGYELLGYYPHSN